MKLTSVLLALIALTFLAGCGGSGDVRSQPAKRVDAPRPSAPGGVVRNRTPSPPVTPAPPAPPTITADLAGFASGEVIAVAFKEINAKGYPIVTLENLTGRDIETIRGSFHLRDSEGNILHSTGLTIAVPGHVFIAADSTEDSSPYGLNRKAELMQKLAASPNELSFSFEAQDVTFLESQASADGGSSD